MDQDEEVVGALEQLYRTGYPRFFRLALAVLDSREAAADAVHEGFVRSLRARTALRDETALEAWVWRTVLNTSIGMRAARARRAIAEAAAVPVEVDPGSDDDWDGLREAVATLPERQRSVLFLRHYADLDYESIGRVLGIARGTVAATLHQAHAALRRTIEVPAPAAPELGARPRGQAL